MNYTPNDGFTGSDTFEFEAFDATSEFPRMPARATVTIKVDAQVGGRRLQTTRSTTEGSTPLTAALENVPQTHDGSGAFSVELILSEEVSIGYATVRDSVFEVTAGIVVSASRKNRGSNLGWVVRIQPSGVGDVEIVVPSGGPCSRAGAICSSDGRSNSSRLEAIVRGPG